MMKKSSCYIYYTSLSQKIIKMKYLHVFFLFIENFFYVVLILDNSNILYGKNISDHYKLMKIFNLNEYLSQNSVLFIIFLFFIIVYLLYFFSHFLFTFNCFQIIFINFYEICHIRIFTFFYFLSLFSLHNSQLILAYFIIISYYLISLTHILYFHLPFYSLKHVRFVYDSLSSSIDSTELTGKMLLILSNSLGKKYTNISKHFFYIVISMYIFQTLNLIYIMKYKSFFFMNNIVINKFRVSMIFFKLLIFFISLNFANDGLLQKRMSIIYVNIFIITIVIFMLTYNPFEYIYFKSFGYLIENTYFYFFSNYLKNEKNKLLFYHKINEYSKNEFLNNENNDENSMSFIHNFLCDNEYFQFIQLFLKEIKQNKLNDLWKNRIIMVRLILLINKYQEKNFILSMNLKSLFELINIHNNLERTYEIVNKLELFINFLDDAHQLLFFINDIIHKNFNVSLTELVDLSKIINKINNKNYKKRLLKNKSSESSYFSIVCGLFYEEILNKSLTKNNFQIRENLSQYKDSINFLYENNNKITLTLNFNSDECRIIQIGKDLFDNFKNDFSLLFPEDFRDYQIILFKNGIFDFKYEVQTSNKRRSIRDKRQSNLSYLLKNSPTSKDISFKFIVKTNKKGNLGFMYLDLKMLFDNSFKNYIVLNGYYYIKHNCLFTYKKNIRDSEKIYKLEISTGENEEEERNPQSLKNYLKENKISNSKLSKIHSFQLNGLTYIIYNIEDNKNSKEKDALSIFKMTSKNINDTYLEQFNQKVEDSSSVAGSLLSGTSSNESNYFANHMRKSNLKRNKHHKELYILYIFQKLLLIISFVSIIISLFEFFLKKKKKNILFDNYSILSRFRTLNRLYYHSIPGVMITMCLARIDEDNCTRYLDYYNLRFIERYNIVLNFSQYFYRENSLKIENFKNTSSFLFNEIYLLKDHRTDNFFEYQINYINILQNEGYFYLVNQTIEFKEGIKIFYNTMAMLTGNDNYFTKSTYLLNITNNPLSSIYFKTQLEDFQLAYYTIIANFNTFCHYFYKIHHEFNEVMNSKLESYKTLNYIFLSLSSIIHIVYFIITFLYLKRYKKVSLEIFNIVRKRTNSRDFRIVFTKKIEILSVLLKIYSVNPNHLIGNLNDLYSSYKRKEREKTKKNSHISISSLTYDDFQLVLYKEEDLKKNDINSMYENLLMLILLILILYYIILLTLYLIYFKKYSLVFSLIQQSSVAECTGYRDFIFYVNRLYNNITENIMADWLNISILQETSDVIYALHLISKERQGLGQLYQPLSNYFTIDCNDFYEKIGDNLIDRYNILYKGENIYSKLSSFCYKNQIMEYNDEYKINTEQFSYIKKGLIQTDYNSIDQVIQTLNNNDFFRSGLFCLLIYRPLRTAENKFVYENALNKMKEYMTIMNQTNIFLGLFFDLSILFICLFIYIKSINAFHKQIARMKDLFYICHLDNVK